MFRASSVIAVMYSSSNCNCMSGAALLSVSNDVRLWACRDVDNVTDGQRCKSWWRRYRRLTMCRTVTRDVTLWYFPLNAAQHSVFSGKGRNIAANGRGRWAVLSAGAPIYINTFCDVKTIVFIYANLYLMDMSINTEALCLWLVRGSFCRSRLLSRVISVFLTFRKETWPFRSSVLSL